MAEKERTENYEMNNEQRRVIQQRRRENRKRKRGERIESAEKDGRAEKNSALL